MTKGLFDGLALTDCAKDLARNIVSLRQSQNIFDDLSDDPGDQAEARTAEMAANPPEYGVQPITQHPELVG